MLSVLCIYGLLILINYFLQIWTDHDMFFFEVISAYGFCWVLSDMWEKNTEIFGIKHQSDTCTSMDIRELSLPAVVFFQKTLIFDSCLDQMRWEKWCYFHMNIVIIKIPSPDFAGS